MFVVFYSTEGYKWRWGFVLISISILYSPARGWEREREKKDFSLCAQHVMNKLLIWGGLRVKGTGGRESWRRVPPFLACPGRIARSGLKSSDFPSCILDSADHVYCVPNLGRADVPLWLSVPFSFLKFLGCQNSLSVKASECLEGFICRF